MLWFIIAHLFETLLAWMSIGRLSNQEKDLELLVLRQQVRMLEGYLPRKRRENQERVSLPGREGCCRASLSHPDPSPPLVRNRDQGRWTAQTTYTGRASHSAIDQRWGSRDKAMGN